MEMDNEIVWSVVCDRLDDDIIGIVHINSLAVTYEAMTVGFKRTAAEHCVRC